MHVAGLVPRSPLPRRPAFRAHPHQQVRSLGPGLAETLVKVTGVADPVTGHDEIFPSPLVGHSESSKTSVNFGQVAAGWSAHPPGSALPDGLANVLLVSARARCGLRRTDPPIRACVVDGIKPHAETRDGDVKRAQTQTALRLRIDDQHRREYPGMRSTPSRSGLDSQLPLDLSQGKDASGGMILAALFDRAHCVLTQTLASQSCLRLRWRRIARPRRRRWGLCRSRHRAISSAAVSSLGISR